MSDYNKINIEELTKENVSKYVGSLLYLDNILIGYIKTVFNNLRDDFLIQVDIQVFKRENVKIVSDKMLSIGFKSKVVWNNKVDESNFKFIEGNNYA